MQDHRTIQLKGADGDDQLFYVCEGCGSMLGPQLRHRERHGRWNADLTPSLARDSE